MKMFNRKIISPFDTGLIELYSMMAISFQRSGEFYGQFLMFY